MLKRLGLFYVVLDKCHLALARVKSGTLCRDEQMIAKDVNFAVTVTLSRTARARDLATFLYCARVVSFLEDFWRTLLVRACSGISVSEGVTCGGLRRGSVYSVPVAASTSGARNCGSLFSLDSSPSTVTSSAGSERTLTSEVNRYAW